MVELLPSAFFFRCSFPVTQVEKIPRKGKSLLNLPAGCRLPQLTDAEGESFGELRLAWNPKGLAVSVEVRGRDMEKPLQCSESSPEDSDGLRVWIDTRNTQNIHRATRFCHQLCLLPAGGGQDKTDPLAIPRKIPRAREESVLPDPQEILLAVERKEAGYLLEVWLPSVVLAGFDPDASPKLGFYYHLRDSVLGDQYLSIGPNFPFQQDPSLWWTLELLEN